MVNLIIEGIDKAGKSTIIEAFIKKHPEFSSRYCGEAPNNCDKKAYYSEYFELMKKFFAHDDNIIFDRLHLGELVYGKLYRNYDIEYFENYERFIRRKSDTVLVLLLADPMTILRRFDDKGVMPRNDVLKVLQAFTKAYERSQLNKVCIDTSYNDVDDCIYIIEHAINTYYGFTLPAHCDKCGRKVDNYEAVKLSDYKIKHKRC